MINSNVGPFGEAVPAQSDGDAPPRHQQSEGKRSKSKKKKRKKRVDSLGSDSVPTGPEAVVAAGKQ